MVATTFTLPSGFQYVLISTATPQCIIGLVDVADGTRKFFDSRNATVPCQAVNLQGRVDGIVFSCVPNDHINMTLFVPTTVGDNHNTWTYSVGKYLDGTLITQYTNNDVIDHSAVQLNDPYVAGRGIIGLTFDFNANFFTILSVNIAAMAAMPVDYSWIWWTVGFFILAIFLIVVLFLAFFRSCDCSSVSNFSNGNFVY